MATSMNATQIRLLSYLAGTNGATLGEAEKQIGVNKGTLFNQIQPLVESGLVRKEGKKYVASRRASERFVVSDYRGGEDLTPAYETWLKAVPIYVNDNIENSQLFGSSLAKILAEKPWLLR